MPALPYNTTLFQEQESEGKSLVFYLYMRAYNIGYSYIKMKKKSLQQNVFPQLKPKKNLPVIDIWNRMTVSELATSAGRNIDDVMDAIFVCDSSGHYNKNTVVEDPNVLYNAVRKLGAKFKVIPRPDSKIEKITNDCDVVKRY